MSRVFDGVNQALYTTGNPLGSSNVFTLSCWFYPTTDGVADQAVLGYGPSAAASPYMMLEVLGTIIDDPLSFSIWTGGAWRRYQVGGIQFNAWNHGCAVSSALASRVAYLNGEVSGVGVDADDLSACNRLAVGVTADSTPNYYYPGRVAEVAGWDIGLTSREVRQLSAGVPAWMIQRSHLVLFSLPMSHAYRTDRDFSRSRAHFSPNNAPIWAIDPPRVLAYRQQMLRDNPTLTHDPTWRQFHPEICKRVAGYVTPIVGGNPWYAYAQQ